MYILVRYARREARKKIDSRACDVRACDTCARDMCVCVCAYVCALCIWEYHKLYCITISENVKPDGST